LKGWVVEFYDKKIERDFSRWPTGIKAKFLWILDLVEEFGPEEIGMPHIKALGQGLFEIRAKGLEGIGRAFFCITKGKVILIVSGCIKKTQKTPQDEILLARKRVLEIKNEK